MQLLPNVLILHVVKRALADDINSFFLRHVSPCTLFAVHFPPGDVPNLWDRHETLTNRHVHIKTRIADFLVATKKFAMNVPCFRL